MSVLFCKHKIKAIYFKCIVLKVIHPGADPGFPVGGAPTLVGGGTNLRHRHFLVKTYVKTKEFGPVGRGGARRKLLYVDPPLTPADIYMFESTQERELS